ncbi:MAG: hypothetical protein ACI8XO_004258 [Verrucomicrobiales bacterium]|jgi:hypothetical protein
MEGTSAEIWSLVPLGNPTPPHLEKGWERNAIDAFIAESLGTAEPGPQADRRFLIRRATYDLIGLPPEPGDVEASSPTADPMRKPSRMSSRAYSPQGTMENTGGGTG